MAAPAPDLRILQANERTLLAWVRTSLTLLAGGVAVDQLAEDTAQRTVLALTLIGLALGTVVAGTLRYRAADAALRTGRLPARGHAPYLVTGAVALVALGAAVAVLA